MLYEISGFLEGGEFYGASLSTHMTTFRGIVMLKSSRVGISWIIRPLKKRKFRTSHIDKRVIADHHVKNNPVPECKHIDMLLESKGYNNVFSVICWYFGTERNNFLCHDMN
jgi:hypothetical protein